MNRIIRTISGLGAILALLLVIAAPVVLADGPTQRDGSFLLGIDRNVSVPAGEQVDAVVVISADALIEGNVTSVTLIDGTATLRGGTVNEFTIVNGTLNLEAGSTVVGNVNQLDSTVNTATGVTIGGTVRPLAQDVAGMAIFLGFAGIMIWLGLAIATLVAGLALAAFAARQTRTAEAIISHEPIKAILIGLVTAIGLPILTIILMVTIVGLPLGLSGLLFVLPTLAFIGYLVAAIWMGEWILARTNRAPAERPYLAAFLGLLTAAVLGFVPLFTAIISLFGLGAITVAGWRTLVGSPARPSFQTQPVGLPG